MPAARTMAALLATSATARPLRRGETGLASAVPSVGSTVCCLRNHPDRDTAEFPLHGLFQRADNKKDTTLGASNIGTTLPYTDARDPGLVAGIQAYRRTGCGHPAGPMLASLSVVR